MTNKLLFVPSDAKNGVWYYRCLRPMQQMNHVCAGEWDITINQTIQWTEYDYLKQFDIIVIHNGTYAGDTQDKFWEFLVWAKHNGIKTVLDVDDYWEYGKDHPLFDYCISNAIPFKVSGSLKLVDAVTTTTERFAEKIRQLNENVYVVPNALCFDDKQFTTAKRITKRLKLGLAGGSSHTNDIKELINANDSFLNYMTNNQLDQIQIVLCGFDLRGKVNIVDETGKVIERRDMKTDDIWWVKIEKLLTKNYTTVSKEYADLLRRYDGSDKEYDASDEPYKRIWTTSIADGEYGKIYEDIDVLLVPLKKNEFNSCKSELKFIEAGWTSSVILASNVAPYSDWGRDGDDCVLVGSGPKNWARAIKKVIRERQELSCMADRLRSRVKAERNLDKISIWRSNVYKKIIEG